ncbi:flavoprotein [Egibacter rhizosphaerae]|uniref:Flavoprotein n=1 Tax=Egibacter rhizosphaerae TaxID=1670831 RepID=A0A411YEZ9_9ACTN|nr:FAD-dependent oxidoreductase [Egibacter rhizosphaerae]QBI19790.1 flavoprotein [Egibacter rhizosphaerae]
MSTAHTFDTDTETPVAVLGAGPVGLAATAHLHARGLPVVLLEAGDRVATAVREWAHVRLFSPWAMLVDPAARELLAPTGWREPDPEGLPTGGEWVTEYLQPLAETPAIAHALRLSTRVVAVSRERADRLADTDRDRRPFVLHLRGPGGERRLRARAVIDATGTWFSPNPLGADGLPALGEEAEGDRIPSGMPDVLGADRTAHAGRRTAIVGSGHSAQQVIGDLARLVDEEPGTEVVWVTRGDGPAFGGGSADQLPARAAVGETAQAAVDRPGIDLVTRFPTDAVTRDEQGVVLHAGDRSIGPLDVVVRATGFRPELRLLAELRLDLHPSVESTRALAPLIDPNVHSCGTVPPHGAAELAHPDEPDLYVVGMKSYGRAPTFLARTGYEQVRSVAAALAGDAESAQRIDLELPETGVCGAPTPTAELATIGTGCCET